MCDGAYAGLARAGNITLVICSPMQRTHAFNVEAWSPRRSFVVVFVFCVVVARAPFALHDEQVDI